MTKAKLAVTYRDSHCEVRAQSPTPLLVIKKVMALKAKEKHLSLNMDVKTDLEVIATLLAKMSPQITDLVSIRKQH